MKKLTALILVLAMCLTFAGCGCKHEWYAATCEVPKTCSLCGETEGEANGHSIVAATCEEAEHCENCNYVSGEPLGHTWVDATTEAPRTCKTCGATDGERIITDSRFTTASTAQLQGKWLMEVELTGEMMGIADFPGGATMNLIMQLGNDGSADFTVELTDSFMEALSQYTVDMMYAEFAAQGMDTEAADEMFEAAYGMSIQDYVAQEISTVNMDEMYAAVFDAMDLGGVYYVADGLLYTGTDWDDVMEATEYTLDGDTLVIDQMAEELGNDGTFARVTE